MAAPPLWLIDRSFLQDLDDLFNTAAPPLGNIAADHFAKVETMAKLPNWFPTPCDAPSGGSASRRSPFWSHYHLHKAKHRRRQLVRSLYLGKMNRPSNSVATERHSIAAATIPTVHGRTGSDIPGAETLRSRACMLLCQVSLAALFYIGLTSVSPAQTVPIDPGPFPPVRYDEDNRRLADPALRTGFFDPLKYIPLGSDPDYYLSFGGEVRERYEHYTNENFGLVGAPKEDYLLSRILLHADLHLGQHIRTFLQFSSEQAPGRDFRTPVDRDNLDLAQGFLDLSTPIGSEGNATLRTGRQEILLGSGRFVDVREGPNTRQSYDGFRFFTTFSNGARVDLFLTRPVEVDSGVFDDRPDDHQVFSGIYGTIPVGTDNSLNLDGYYYYLQTEKMAFVTGAPTDDRHTVGMRVWGAANSWDYDTDLLFQLGTQGSSDIRAGGVATKFGYTLSGLEWRPRLGMQADYFSGGQGGHGQTVNSFNPLFPRGGYFSEPGLQAFDNLIDAYPSITLNPLDTLTIMSGVDFAWRANTTDAVYITPNVPIPNTASASGRYIGTSFVLQASWTVTRNVSLNGSYVHLLAGPAITNANGKDIDYVALWTSLKF